MLDELEVTATATPVPSLSIPTPLFEAQQHVVPVTKDARNDYQGFDYASAESVLQAARAALGAAGVSVARLGIDLEIKEGYWILCSTYQVTGDPQYSEPFVRKFPLVPGKGRPLDKSLAVALTTDLAYTLRDLLLIPRLGVDESIDARNDAEQSKKTQTRQRKSEGVVLEKWVDHGVTAGALTSPSIEVEEPDTKERDPITPESYRAVSALIKETQTDMRLFLAYFNADELADLDEQEAQQARLILLKKKGQ